MDDQILHTSHIPIYLIQILMMLFTSCSNILGQDTTMVVASLEIVSQDGSAILTISNEAIPRDVKGESIAIPPFFLDALLSSGTVQSSIILHGENIIALHEIEPDGFFPIPASLEVSNPYHGNHLIFEIRSVLRTGNIGT